MDLNEIMSRQNIISLLIEQRQLRKIIRNLLNNMGDLERLAGRASAGHAGARDLIAIADSLQKLPRLSINLQNHIRIYHLNYIFIKFLVWILKKSYLIRRTQLLLIAEKLEMLVIFLLKMVNYSDLLNQIFNLYMAIQLIFHKLKNLLLTIMKKK